MDLMDPMDPDDHGLLTTGPGTAHTNAEVGTGKAAHKCGVRNGGHGTAQQEPHRGPKPRAAAADGWDGPLTTVPGNLGKPQTSGETGPGLQQSGLPARPRFLQIAMGQEHPVLLGCEQVCE
jgi:hypothetical protein